MSSDPSPGTRSQTLRDFRRGWTPDPRTAELGWWLEWPPDLFALTSVWLQRTGAYRRGVRPTVAEFKDGTIRPTGDARPVHRKGWDRHAERAAAAWHDWLAGRGSGLDKWMRDHVDTLAELEGRVTLDQLGASTLDPDSRRALRAVLSLHAIADMTCQGLGIVSSRKARGSLVHGLASLLLVMKGSLSRIQKQQGVVLPKTRTPQSGLTLRSFSHHLSFHTSEVDVLWRSVPWTARASRDVNILLIPWPFTIRPSWFKSHGKGPGGNVGYFSFSPGPSGQLDPAMVLELIDAASVPPDVLVFPELSLTEHDLHALQSALASQLGPNLVPMIVAGVRSPSQNPEEVGASPIENGVVFSTWFAGKWYRLVQHKHHRWKMDAGQVEQYGIQGALAPYRKPSIAKGRTKKAEATGGARKEEEDREEMTWWEGFVVRPRRLSFLAPNAWLNLCPLVCEDLAQFEPVSEVIRGVGPTLLIALLLDGPQLQVRWPSRYATVLASDPGSAVLTVTSLGMAERSRGGRSHEPSRVIALWRDADGPVEIKVHKNAQAVMLKVQGDFTEELTADGRSDGGGAARFSLPREGGRYVPEQVRLKKGRKRHHVRRGSAALEVGQTFTDMRELATATFLIDVALEAREDVLLTLEEWAQGHRADAPIHHTPGAGLVEVFEEVLAHQTPGHGPGSGSKRKGIGRDLRYAVVVFSALIRDARSTWKGGELESVAWWSCVLDAAKRWLAEGRDVRGSFFGLPRTDRRRIAHAIPQAVAWAVHNRLVGAAADATSARKRKKARDELSRVEELVSYAAGLGA